MSDFIKVPNQLRIFTAGDFQSIDNPSPGELAYNSSTGRYYFWDHVNSSWKQVEVVGGQKTTSISLDGGNERIKIAANSAFEATDVFSVSAWINAAATATDVIAGHYESAASSNRRWAWLTNSNGKLSTWLSISGGSIQKDYDTGATVLDSTWHHVAWTFNGSNATADQLTIYVDGAEDTPTKVADNACTSLHPATGIQPMIGALDPSAPSLHWPGKIAHLSFWHAELTATQISELYNGGYPPNLVNHSAYDDLVGWWKLGAGDVWPTAYDSVNDNDGTMENMEAEDIYGDGP